MSDLIDAAKSLRQRRQDIVTAENKADNEGGPETAPSGPARRRGSSYADAKRTERTGSEGEKQYGAPLKTAPSPSTSREQIRAEISKQISKMVNRQHTDGNN